MSSKNFDVEDTMKRATAAFTNALKIPQLTSVRFEGASLSTENQQSEEHPWLKGAVSVRSTWAQSSVISGSKIGFFRTDFCVQEKASVEDGGLKYNSVSGHTMPLANDPDSFISDYCSENQLEVVIRKRTKGGNKDEAQFILEMWKPTHLLSSVNLTDLNAHGEVYLDGELGTVAINQQGTKVAYIAEEKRPKSEPFFKGYGAKVVNSKKDTEKADEDKEKDKTAKGQEYRFVEDFGEQLVGKHQTVIVIYDLETDELKVLPRKTSGLSKDTDDEGILPSDVCPGLLVWDENGKSLYGIATFTQPRRLGLIYCSNRKSNVFKVCLEGGKYFDLSSQGGKGENISCRSPRIVKFNDNSKYLIWLERDLSVPNYPGPHQSCFRLMKMNMVGKNKPEVVIDIKNSYNPKTDDFAGLYMARIGKKCIVADDTIILTTIVNDTFTPILCNLVTGNYQALNKGGCHVTVHDSIFDPVSKKNLVVGCRSLPLQPPHVVIGTVELGDKVKLSCSTIGDVVKLDGIQLDDFTWKTLHHIPKHVIKGYEDVQFSSIYIGPTKITKDDGKVPLILWPHGGPHSVISTSFMSDVYYFLMLGYGVLFVNYRGSLGAGNDSVMSLPGNVGSSDVKDCYQALQECLDTYKVIDHKRICLFGGSHGGFLVTHLAGQYPTDFKAVVARNPVVNISSMYPLTDIPDWGCNEAGFPFSFSSSAFKNSDVVSKMYLSSPIAHVANVKTPIYLMIGKNDLRVPPSQGYEYYHALKALNSEADVRMNIYDDCHPLSKEAVHSNVMINVALFYNEMLTV